MHRGHALRLLSPAILVSGLASAQPAGAAIADDSSTPPEPAEAPVAADSSSPPSSSAHAQSRETLIEVDATETTTETASTTWVTPVEFTAAPRRSAEELLRAAPGVAIVQHGSEGKGYQFFVRGFDAEHGADFAIDVESVTINEWSNVHAQGYLDLGFLIPEVVAEVQVDKAAYSVDQGAFAVAGSARYRLGVDPKRLSWYANYAYGSTQRHRLLVSYSPHDGDGSSFVALEGLHDEGFGKRRGIDRLALVARARVLETQEHTWTLWSAGHVAGFELPTPVRADDVRARRIDLVGSYDDELHGRSIRWIAATDYHWSGTRQRVESSLSLGFRDLELLENFTGAVRQPEFGDRRAQSHRAWSWAARLEHTLKLLRGLQWSYRLDLQGDHVEQREHDIGRGLEIVARTHDLAGLQWHPAVSTRVDWQLGRAFHFDLGLRLDAFSMRVFGEDAQWQMAASPRLRGRVRLGSSNLVYASYGRGFRAPSLRAIAGRDGDGNTKRGPALVRSDGFELGWRAFLGSALESTLAGFATLLGRESVFDHVSGTSIELAATQRLGGELTLTANIAKFASVTGELTFVDARFRGSGELLPYAPRWMGVVRLNSELPGHTRLGFRVLLLAPRPLPFGARSSSFVRGDLVLAWALRPWFVELEIENLFSLPLHEAEYNFASHWPTRESFDPLPAIHISPGPPFNLRVSLGAKW